MAYFEDGIENIPEEANIVARDYLWKFAHPNVMSPWIYENDMMEEWYTRVLGRVLADLPGAEIEWECNFLRHGEFILWLIDLTPPEWFMKGELAEYREVAKRKIFERKLKR